MKQSWLQLAACRSRYTFKGAYMAEWKNLKNNRETGKSQCGLTYCNDNLGHNGKESFCQFLLGLSVNRNITGYALLKSDLKPLKFGIIDLEGLPTIHERAAEVTGVLTILKERQENDYYNYISNSESRSVKWKIGLQMYSRIPHSLKEAQKSSDNHKLIAIIEFNCSQLFRSVPYDVDPKLARSYLSMHNNKPLESRSSLFEFARSQILDFPILRKNDESVSEMSYYMSDAWGIAVYLSKLYQMELLESDRDIMQKVKKKIDCDRNIIHLRDVICNTNNNAIVKDLQNVLKCRIQSLKERLLIKHIVQRSRNKSITS